MQNTEHFRIVFLNSHLLYYPGSEDSSGADDSSASSTVRKEDSLDIEEEKPKVPNHFVLTRVLHKNRKKSHK